MHNSSLRHGWAAWRPRAISGLLMLGSAAFMGCAEPSADDLGEDGDDTAAVAQAVTQNSDRLIAGETLKAGESIVSKNGIYSLHMQSDGNLVLYGDEGLVWFSSNTFQRGVRATLTASGSLAIYNAAGQVVWTTGTDGRRGSSLVVQNDGNLVLYATGGAPLWGAGVGEGRKLAILDPGHGKLLGPDGQLHYQRPPSPTYGLYEDDVTLLIAREVAKYLEQHGVSVQYTRVTEKAPTALRNIVCKPPYDYCNEDLKLRLDAIEAMELRNRDAMFVSIHTNGSDLPIVGGFAQGWRVSWCKSTSLALAADMGVALSGVGMPGHTPRRECDLAVLSRTQEMGLEGLLVELGYLSNNHAPPLTKTDEKLLNDPAFREKAGARIGTAIARRLNK